MNIFVLRNLYQKNNLSEDDMRQAVQLIMELNQQIDLDIDAINETSLDELIRYLVRTKQNSVASFVIMMRYYNAINRKDLFIHLTKYTGMLHVMDNIILRLEQLHGKKKAEQILSGFQAPILGTPPSRLPDYVEQLMNRLDGSLTKEETEEVLAGNNHGVSKEPQLAEKVEYETANSLEDYLRDRHQRKVNELKKHMEENKIWFEQIITPEVVDFVASNQEILSGVLKDNALYITKIPFDTKAYLEAKTKQEKAYYGCHCPFAREALKEGKEMNDRFCYCSAGFAKFPFEIILDQPLKIKVVKSILHGDDVCRFKIDLENVNYKR